MASCFFMPFTALSQVASDTFFFNGRGELAPGDANQPLNRQIFKKIYNRQFAALVTNSSNSNFGNYAAFDIKETEASLGLSTIFDSGSVLSFKASGGVNDGFFELFSNSVFNTKVGFEAKFQHSLSYKPISINNDALRRYEVERKNIIRWYALESDDSHIKFTQCATLKMLKKIKEEESRKLDSLINRGVGALATDEKLALQEAILVSRIRLDSIKAAIEDLPPAYLVKSGVMDAYKEKIRKLNLDSAVGGYNMSWFSYSYSVNNNSMFLVDSVKDAGNRILENVFVSQEVKIQFSTYRWRMQNSYYYHLGLAGALGDNLKDLKKIDVVERKRLGVADTLNETEKKMTAFDGPYRENIKSVTLYGEAYYFLGKRDRIAAHLNSEWKVADFSKAIWNLGVGLLFSAKDGKDNTTIVNFELYYRFNDLLHHTESDLRLWDRNSMGVQLAFPIKFKQ